MSKSLLVNRIIFLLSIAGIFVSLYLLKAYTSQSSFACLTGEGCQIVKNSPYAYPFGIPMPAIGLAGFSIITALSFLITLNHKFNKYFIAALLAVSSLGLLLVIYLTSLEIWVIKAFCSWCLTAALIQTIIFLLAIYIFKKT